MKDVKAMALALAILVPGVLAGPSPAWAHNRHMMNVEEHVQELKEKLNLTADQETQVRSIVQEKKRKVEDAMQEAHDRIRNLLETEEQRNEFNEMMMKKEKKD